MKQKNLARRCLLMGLVVSGCMAGTAWSADEYPSRPIRMIVPYAPGGASDAVARLLSQKLSEALKQTVVVENRAAAGGIVGTEAVARAAPDGYTLLMTTAGAQTLSPALYKVSYDPVKSFAPISLISNIGFIVVVHPSIPATTMQEYVALARSKNRPMSFAAGSSMVGLIGEQFKMKIGTPDMVNVMYKGSGPGMLAVLGGEVDMTFDPFSGLEMIRSGKLRALAVLSPKRSPALPQVPTMHEAGIDGMTFSSWAGMLAPAGTPPAIIHRLNAELVQIVAMPDVRQQLERMDYEPVGSSPEQFSATIAEDTARWAKLVKTSNFAATP